MALYLECRINKKHRLFFFGDFAHWEAIDRSQAGMFALRFYNIVLKFSKSKHFIVVVCCSFYSRDVSEYFSYKI